MIKISVKSHTTDVFAELDQFRKDGLHCDFTIRCGDKEIPVHKCLIAACSEYFRAMLRHNMKEYLTESVEIKDLDPDLVATCIDFMYSGEASFPDDRLAETVHVARVLQLNKLCDHISELMKQNLSLDSFYATMDIANCFGLQNLSKACNKFATYQFHALMKMDEFKSLDAKFLMTLMSSECLSLLDVVKCKAFMLWGDSDPKRSKEFFSLLKILDITKVQLCYRKFLLQNPIVTNSKECLRFIRSSMPEESNVESSDYEGDCNPGLFTVDSTSHKLVRFDFVKQSYTEVCELPFYRPCVEYSLALVGQDLFLIHWEQSMYRLNIADKESYWTNLSPPIQHCSGFVTVLQGFLYLSNAGPPSASIGRYHMADDIWSLLPPKKLSTASSCITAAHGKLYVISGGIFLPDTIGPTNVSDVEYFDPTSSTWSSICKLNVGRISASACSHEDAIYVFGGSGEAGQIESAEILYPHASSWELVKTDGPRHSLSHSFNGKIYIVGGYIVDSARRVTVVVYDPDSKTVICEWSLNPEGQMVSNCFSSALAII